MDTAGCDVPVDFRVFLQGIGNGTLSSKALFFFKYQKPFLIYCPQLRVPVFQTLILLERNRGERREVWRHERG